MRPAVVILAIVLTGSIFAPARAEKLALVPGDDPETAQFAKLAESFFLAVKSKDSSKFEPLFEPADFAWFKERIAEKSNPEYDLLYGDRSPAHLFSKWREVRWVAARKDPPYTNIRGDGVTLCLADRHGPVPQWPPRADELRKLERDGIVFCNFTYRMNGRRVFSSSFLHPDEEEGVPAEEITPPK